MMKAIRLALLVLPLLLTACGLSDQQKADYASVQSSGVSSAIYDKMVHGDALSLGDIRALAHARVSDAVVIRYIRDHGSVYFLSAENITYLEKGGVSQTVIDFMMQTQQFYGAPGPYPYYPYPYPYVGFGFGWGPGWGPGYGHHHWR